MKIELLRIITIAVVSLGSTFSTVGATSPSLLDELDKVVNSHHDNDAQIRQAISEGWNDFAGSPAANDRYNILRGLYELYRSYKIDSAIIVADMRLATARQLNDPFKTSSATLNLAEGYARSGASDKAIAVLDTINESFLKDYHVKYRNSIYRSAYEMKAETALLASDRLEALDMIKKFRDEAASSTTGTSKGSYTLEAERLRNAGMLREAVAKMEEADRLFDFSNDAAMQYAMGETYLAAGMRSQAMESLARSAIIDLSSGTKEYRSLILLASILYDEGQIERAFRYINCAFDDAIFSNANLRTAEIMKSMPVIDSAFHEAQNEINQRTRRFLVFTAVLSVLLLMSLALMAMAFRAKRKREAKIEEINRRLEMQNQELALADSLKLKHINALMMAYAGYISRLKDFRRTIMRLLKTSQYDKAFDAARSERGEAHDIAVFHEMFDQSFLSMFPKFIDEINSFMKVPVELKSESRLTPELRLAAMMKLGITSTDDIAKMMHYSAQTVYNLRTTLRGMLSISWEDFETYMAGQ